MIICTVQFRRLPCTGLRKARVQGWYIGCFAGESGDDVMDIFNNESKLSKENYEKRIQYLYQLLNPIRKVNQLIVR